MASTDCMLVVLKMSKNRIDKYLIKLLTGELHSIEKSTWALNKPRASLSAAIDIFF